MFPNSRSGENSEPSRKAKTCRRAFKDTEGLRGHTELQPPSCIKCPTRARMPVRGGPSDQPRSPPPAHFLPELVNTGGQAGWARKASPDADLTRTLEGHTKGPCSWEHTSLYPPPRTENAHHLSSSRKASPPSGISNELPTMGSLPGKGPGAEMSLAPTYPLFSTGLTQSLSMPCGHSVNPTPQLRKGASHGKGTERL